MVRDTVAHPSPFLVHHFTRAARDPCTLQAQATQEQPPATGAASGEKEQSVRDLEATFTSGSVNYSEAVSPCSGSRDHHASLFKTAGGSNHECAERFAAESGIAEHGAPSQPSLWGPPVRSSVPEPQ